MRKILVAGNWKMNLTRNQAEMLAREIAGGSQHAPTELAVCPPFVYLETVIPHLAESSVKLGAQDVYHQADGAFTGEISTSMLQDVGCHYVILGHSERRHVIGETDALVNAKVLAAIQAGLVPIVCVGETLEERESGQTTQVVERQFRGSLAGVEAAQMPALVIAYEPVWAIGTGKVATPEQAEAVHADLRKMIESSYNLETAAQVRILYGGSVKPDNAATLLAQPNIDGALVGGASLKSDSFLAISAAAAV